MFEHDLFRLNASIADGLKSIKGLKNLFGGLQQYEHTAKLRDIEKQLETIEKALPYFPYPASNPILKPGGELYFRQLFTYAQLHCWDIPETFVTAFKDRKTKLNDSIEFRNESTRGLISLNRKLSDAECKAVGFSTFLNELIALKSVVDILEEVATGNVLVQCYTQNSKYACSPHGFDHQKPFYQFTLPVGRFLSGVNGFYETNDTNNAIDSEFLGPLPLELRDEKIAYLFFVLATEGLLAWEDFLNIDKVEIVIDIKYRFTTGNEYLG
jgi:hypothetical protein